MGGKLPLAINLILTVALAAFLAEAYLIWQEARRTATLAANGQVDSRSPIEVALDLGASASGIDAVTSLYPQHFLRDHRDDPKAPPVPISNDKGLLPLAGIAGNRTVFCRVSAAYRIYDAHRHGFNNPPGL